MTLRTIEKVSYNGRKGFTFTDDGRLIKFSNRQYVCSIRKEDINAVEYTVFRNVRYLVYALLVFALFAFRFVNDPQALYGQLSGRLGTSAQYLLMIFGLSGVVSYLGYLFPDSKLVIYAGSFKCVVDGQDQKLIQIEARLQA